LPLLLFHTYADFQKSFVDRFGATTNHGIVIYPPDEVADIRASSAQVWFSTNAFGAFMSNQVMYAYLGITTNYGAKPQVESGPQEKRRWPAAAEMEAVIREEDARAGRNTEVRAREALLRQREPNLRKGMTPKDVLAVMGVADQIRAKLPAEPNDEGLTHMYQRIPPEELQGHEAECIMIFSPWPDWSHFGHLRRTGYRTVQAVFDKDGRLSGWGWVL
jgi:hypothetical protein